MFDYKSVEIYQPDSRLPFCRPWTVDEWTTVCSFRYQLDRLIADLSLPKLDSLAFQRLVEVGEELPCCALLPGIFLNIRISAAGGRIHRLPDDVEGRVQLYDWLERSFRIVPNFPAGPGVFDWLSNTWENGWMFLNDSPSVLLVDSRLLESFDRWAISEVQKRALAIGYQEIESLEIQIALAEIFARDSSHPEASELLRASLQRLEQCQ